MRIYLSGPISGRPEGNRPTFTAAAAKLREAGHEVLNPHELGEELRAVHQLAGKPEPTWEDYMRSCIAGMVMCEAVVVLPGYTKSRGARIECSLAMDLGMPLHLYEQGINNWHPEAA